MALRLISWVDGVSLSVDIVGSNVVAVECTAPANRPAVVTAVRAGNTIADAATVAPGQTQRWTVQKNRQWTFEQTAAEADFYADARSG